jgi:hypothetical protein
MCSFPARQILGIIPLRSPLALALHLRRHFALVSVRVELAAPGYLIPPPTSMKSQGCRIAFVFVCVCVFGSMALSGFWNRANANACWWAAGGAPLHVSAQRELGGSNVQVLRRATGRDTPWVCCSGDWGNIFRNLRCTSLESALVCVVFCRFLEFRRRLMKPWST